MWVRITIKICHKFNFCISPSFQLSGVCSCHKVAACLTGEWMMTLFMQKLLHQTWKSWTLPPQTLQPMMLSLHVAPQMWWVSRDIFTLVVSCVAIFAGKLNQTCFFMWFLRIIHWSHLWDKCDCRASEEVEGLARTLLFSSLFLEHFLSNFQVLFLLLLCH